MSNFHSSSAARGHMCTTLDPVYARCGSGTSPMTNSTAFFTGVNEPLVVKDSEIPTPSDDEVIIRNSAVASNPIDFIVQRTGFLVKQYPVVLGYDAAGTIVAIGANVEKFKVGDRVMALAEGVFSPHAKNGAFQHYFAAKAVTTSHIPASLSFVDAAVLPLGVLTAAAGLFHPENLNLNLPQVPALELKKKLVLIWGGASSVGANAIQLAKAAGYTLLATCSPKNSDFVTGLGAAKTFDYRGDSIVQDVLSFLDTDDSKLEGIFLAAASGDSFDQAASILVKLGHGKLVSAPMYPRDFSPGIDFSWTDLKTGNYTPEMTALATKIFSEFLPLSLEKNAYTVAPVPQVVGEGLESLQAALDANALGVSAKKLVVTL